MNFPDHKPIEVINERRLFGITLASHINDKTKRPTSKPWVLIRFKSFGGTIEQLCQIYLNCVRSTFKYSIPIIFHSGLIK